MYDYDVVTDIEPANFAETMKQWQLDGWNVEQVDRRYILHHDSHHGNWHKVVYDVVFKKAGKNISYGQMLINRYGEKLAGVRDYLKQSRGLSGIETAELARDIDEFLFKGSPEDM